MIAEPFISPLELTITPALSSKYMKQPSCLLKSFLYLIITPYNTKNNKFRIRKKLPFFLKIGLPFLTEQTIISPILAFGSLFYLALCSKAVIIYKFLAPELSAQFMTVEFYRAIEIFILTPTLPPLPLFIVVMFKDI